MESTINSSNVNKLSEEEAASLEGKLTIDELTKALKAMKNEKTPGIDGFPAEFLKVFWGKLKYIVLRALNKGYEEGEMSTSLRQVIISCIPKGNKSRLFLKNWRPISLLSVIYKLNSLAIANRLKTVLDKLISKTQTGFLSGRYIGENARLIYDILHQTEKHKIPGILMLIDFEKAFDSVSWDFLYGVLEYFNFGNGFIKWVRTFNNNITAHVIQSGYLSDPITIGRGCRQGDPIAPYLFILCAQILCLMILQNKDLTGITLNKTEIKLSQYADDTTLILDGSGRSILAALNTLEIYGGISGLKVNTDKTQIVWIGKKKYSKDKIETGRNLIWGNSDFNLLGINFSVNLNDIPDNNYDSLIVKIKELLVKWKKRYLTPIGKITIIKALILPKFNHLFMSLPKPKENTIKIINSLLFKFVWNDKPDKISRHRLTKCPLKGGLNMVDLEKFINALQATWIRRLWCNEEAQWAQIFEHNIISIKKLFTLGPLWPASIVNKVTNPFWRELLLAWSNISANSLCKDFYNFMATPLWYNPKIQTDNVFFPNWYKARIICPADIIDNQGNLLSKKDIENFYKITVNFLDYHRIKTILGRTMRNYYSPNSVSAHIYLHCWRSYKSLKREQRTFIWLKYNQTLLMTTLVLIN